MALEFRGSHLPIQNCTCYNEGNTLKIVFKRTLYIPIRVNRSMDLTSCENSNPSAVNYGAHTLNSHASILMEYII